MPRILDYTGQDVERSHTVASIIASKADDAQLVQVTAGSADEARAAEDAGIDMVVCLANSVTAVRQGSSKLFVTAAIDFDGAVTEDELLRDAFAALNNGADAVITARGLSSVRRLTHEDIPVVGHLGFIPKKSTLYGGVRAVGKTGEEAIKLWDQFCRLEDSGAFAVECEIIPEAVLGQITERTGLVTISLGSGRVADAIFLFTSDICGESPRLPRHGRSYGDLARLHKQINQERIESLQAFRADVRNGLYPDDSEIASIEAAELSKFVASLDN